MWEIVSNFVAFLENLNFKDLVMSDNILTQKQLLGAWFFMRKNNNSVLAEQDESVLQTRKNHHFLYTRKTKHQKTTYVIY